MKLYTKAYSVVTTENNSVKPLFNNFDREEVIRCAERNRGIEWDEERNKFVSNTELWSGEVLLTIELEVEGNVMKTKGD